MKPYRLKFIVDKHTVLYNLQKQIEKCNGLRSFCRKYDLDPGHVSNIVNGKKPITKKIAKALGYSQIIMYREL